VTRLVELGLPAYVVASSLVAVLAQRLVRRLCDCKVVNPDGTASPKGCETCRFSGYKGRMAVYELMRLTPRIRSVLLARASDDMVRRAAQASGMASMFQDGGHKSARGATTMEEIRRVIPPDEVDDDEGPGEQTAVVPASLSPEVRSARPARILLVEDEIPMGQLLREMLLSEGYEVVMASNGAEALPLLYRDKPDLVISDVRMPEMDGIELLKRVRRDLSTRQIPVVLLTAIESSEGEVQALDLGADDYIGKPVQQGSLLGRVRRALFRAHLMRAAN
jgi:PleD family two-component response regulator